MSALIETTESEIINLTEDEAMRIHNDLRKAAESFSSLYLEAYNKRLWVFFGYESWDKYLDVEFGEYRVVPMKENRAQFITELARGGMSNRAIASTADVSTATVSRTTAKARANGELPDDLETLGQDGRTYKPRKETKNLVDDDSFLDMSVEDFGVSHFSPTSKAPQPQLNKAPEETPEKESETDRYGLNLVDDLAQEFEEAIKSAIRSNNMARFNAEECHLERIETLSRVLLANVGLLERLGLQKDLNEKTAKISEILESAVVTIDKVLEGKNEK